MRYFFSIVAITAVLFWGYSSFERENKRSELRQSTNVIEAEILELTCGRRDNIKLRVNDRVFIERIHLSVEECSELSGQETIGIKMDSDGNIAFANDGYNDWSETESVSIVMLNVCLVGLIIYYGILPERFRTRKRKRKNK